MSWLWKRQHKPNYKRLVVLRTQQRLALELDMTITDSLLIFATLCGPVVATQTQKWIERASARRLAQRQVFYDLMATRAIPARVSPKHVEALNRIDLEFSNSSKGKQRDVLNRWRIYADHLNIDLDGATEAAITQWNIKADDLFLDLLEALSTTLGYKFDRVQLNRGIYYPKAHGLADQRRDIFEHEMLRLLTGQSSLNMRVTEFPSSDEASDMSRRLHEKIISAFADDGALKTTNSPRSRNSS